jgi:hypothetical protein
MNTLLLILAAWALVSIPVSLVAARFIRAGQSGDLAHYLPNPKDEP